MKILLSFPGKTRLLLLCWSVLILWPSAPAQPDEPDPQCTKDRKGLPACNFNTRNCWNEPKDDEEAWSHVKVGGQGQYQGPVKPIEKGYVYVDPKISQGLPRKLTGQISTGKEAICVTFYYATTGNNSAPITFYIQEGKVYSPVHRVEANTGGIWLETNFSCCLPDVNKKKLVAFEAASTDDGIVAIDYVDVRRSNMNCTGDELVCYPTLEEKTTVTPSRDQTTVAPTVTPSRDQTTVAPTMTPSRDQTTVVPTMAPSRDQITMAPPKGQSHGEPSKDQRCASDEMHSGVPSCDFNKSPDTCGWRLYDDISYLDNTTHTILVADIEDDVESICMEVQFEVLTTQTDLGNIFATFYTKTKKGAYLWSEVYNYKDEKQTGAKINKFEGPLPESTDRQILFVFQRETLNIDYIHIMASHLTPPLSKEVQETSTKKTNSLFTCSANSPFLKQRLCGMTPVPEQGWSNVLGWTEPYYMNPREDIFPRKRYYILYKGTDQSLRDAPATLSISSVMSSTGVFTLSFSYALSGNAKLEVRALDVRGRDNLAWSSTYESARKWVEVKVTPVNSWGLTKIIFKVLGSSPSTDTPVYVGLTDISITVPDEDNSKDDIGITRGVDGTGRVNGDDVDKNQGDDRDDTISNHSGDDHEDKKDSFEQYGVILLVLVLIIAVVVLIVVVVWKKDRMLPLLRVAPASSLVV